MLRLLARITRHHRKTERRFSSLLRLRLRELAELPTNSLIEIMDDIGAKTRARGMTPEILEDLLSEE